MEKTKSQMLVIPAGGNDLKNPEILVKRLYEAEDFRVESAEAGEECLQVTVICGEESFSMEMYPTGFSIPELYRCQHFFPDIDIEAIQKLEYGLAVEMVFGKDPFRALGCAGGGIRGSACSPLSLHGAGCVGGGGLRMASYPRAEPLRPSGTGGAGFHEG